MPFTDDEKKELSQLFIHDMREAQDKKDRQEAMLVFLTILLLIACTAFSTSLLALIAAPAPLFPELGRVMSAVKGTITSLVPGSDD